MKKFGLFVVAVVGTVVAYECLRRAGVVDQVKSDVEKRVNALKNKTPNVTKAVEEFAQSAKESAENLVEKISVELKG